MTSRVRFRALVPAVFLAVALTVGMAAPSHAILGSVTASWPATTLTTGSGAAVTGTVSGLELGTGVFLQQRTSTGAWQNVARSGLDANRAFRFDIPTWFIGQRTYRIMTTSLLNTTLLGTASTAWTVNVVPAYIPPSQPGLYKYAFSSPTRWNPCQPIGWRINTRYARRGALADTAAAFARISEATGFTFVYRGTTTGIPQNDTNAWYPADTQIVVAWAKPYMSSLFRLYRGAEGVGAAISYSGYYNGDGSATGKIVKGMVVIKPKKRKPGFGRGLTRGDVLLHEIGHTMGLTHIGARSQIMYPYITRGYARLGSGDLMGLQQRGAQLGCMSQVRPALARSTTTTTPTAARVRTIFIQP